MYAPFVISGILEEAIVNKIAITKDLRLKTLTQQCIAL